MDWRPSNQLGKLSELKLISALLVVFSVTSTAYLVVYGAYGHRQTIGQKDVRRLQIVQEFVRSTDSTFRHNLKDIEKVGMPNILTSPNLNKSYFQSPMRARLLGGTFPSAPQTRPASCTSKTRSRHGDIVPWKCLDANSVQKPRLLSREEAEAVQRRRRNHLRKVCNEFYHLSPLDLNSSSPLGPDLVAALGRTYVNDDYNLTVTIVRKAGSTNWKKFMTDLHAISSKSTRLALEPLHKRSQEDIKHALKHYTKVLFVRNPLVRLLSAFRDKFVKLPTRVYVRMADRIIRRIRRERPPNPEQPDLTFTEFLTYIAAVKGRNGDPHWIPVFRACKPCQVRHDFVGKLETLQSDTAYLIDKLGVGGRVQYDYPKPFTGSSNVTRLMDYFSGVPPEIIEKICNLYWDDFVVFDYPMPDDFSNLKSYMETST
ncbi:carbohydrate sulfotransferase 14-like isoform X2 [Acanthaster planci]|nr:carbohydrate sulfotransferase 14-like isoform X2 [Acanthaster planci]XP_022096483.1 carbohydrate sulfotransferase 14-like isoform X2 [Acanthaster planci]XP_022096484.1 carbohydrate sulfotransferase 14-like isoform X2 [Acanthaster planci]XP_022096485.1 carbohydrate sulfotransferase 14-like isoform X2 [Acanthaster planci]